MVSVLDLSHSDRYVAVSRVILILSLITRYGAFFHIRVFHLCVFFGEEAVSSLAHSLIGLFVSLLLGVKSSLCSLDTSPF